MALNSEFTRTVREGVRRAMEEEASQAAEVAAAEGDTVAAAHHEARARAFRDSWRNPTAQREVDSEAIRQLRDSLSHPDHDVRQSARQGLADLGALSR